MFTFFLRSVLTYDCRQNLLRVKPKGTSEIVERNNKTIKHIITKVMKNKELRVFNYKNLHHFGNKNKLRMIRFQNNKLHFKSLDAL